VARMANFCRRAGTDLLPFTLRLGAFFLLAAFPHFMAVGRTHICTSTLQKNSLPLPAFGQGKDKAVGPACGGSTSAPAYLFSTSQMHSSLSTLATRAAVRSNAPRRNAAALRLHEQVRDL